MPAPTNNGCPFAPDELAPVRVAWGLYELRRGELLTARVYGSDDVRVAAVAHAAADYARCRGLMERYRAALEEVARYADGPVGPHMDEPHAAWVARAALGVPATPADPVLAEDAATDRVLRSIESGGAVPPDDSLAPEPCAGRTP